MWRALGNLNEYNLETASCSALDSFTLTKAQFSFEKILFVFVFGIIQRMSQVLLVVSIKLPSYNPVYGSSNRFIYNIIIVFITNRTWSRSRWPFAGWDCGFESRQGHRCLSLVSVMFSGRGLCIKLITRPEESYLLRCV